MSAWPVSRQDPYYLRSLRLHDSCATSVEAQFQESDQVLAAILARAALTAADLSLAKQCLAELRKAAGDLGPVWRVTPFGGIASGFGVTGSDLDVTCYVAGLEASFASLAAQELQTRLLPILWKHPRFEIVDQIWTARVPILRLRFDQTLDVDLSCHNTEALPNTRLLRAYAELAPQVRELGLLIKLWAKAEGVSGAPHGHLSSYALTLMSIYYLQVDPEVEMPCLSTEQFVGSRGADHVAWSCPLSTQALLARFFRFYADEFQWCAEVVSVRRGRRSAAADLAYDQLKSALSARIHIEDPFLIGRNLHCVLGFTQEWALYTAICRAAQDVKCGGLPGALCWASTPFEGQLEAWQWAEAEDSGSNVNAASSGVKSMEAEDFEDKVAASSLTVKGLGDSSAKSGQSLSESTKSPASSDLGSDEQQHSFQVQEGVATDSDGANDHAFKFGYCEAGLPVATM